MIITDIPELHVWRAPTDNDGIAGWTGQEAKPMGRWRKMGLDRIVRTQANLFFRGNFIETKEIYSTSVHREAFTVIQKWKKDCYGKIDLDIAIDISKSITELPRLGLQFKLPLDFDNVQWYGRGPHESYPDRKSGVWLALHESPVKKMWFPYVKPQESGNRSDVRFVTLFNKNGTALRIEGGNPFQFSVSLYSDKIITEAMHINELVQTKCLYLNLDFFQRGLGNEACGPDVLPEYELSGPAKLEQNFRLLLYRYKQS